VVGDVGAWAEDLQSDETDEAMDTPGRPQLLGAFFRQCAQHAHPFRIRIYRAVHGGGKEKAASRGGWWLVFF
jgi:hypothetical protein